MWRAQFAAKLSACKLPQGQYHTQHTGWHHSQYTGVLVSKRHHKTCSARLIANEQTKSNQKSAIQKKKSLLAMKVEMVPATTF
jgi:hypothetical protein